MVSDKKTVQYLIKFCKDVGLMDWVISPGSRNAPITLSVTNDELFNAKPVVDERSAAFVAMGMALGKGSPVGITCTSGSASLNYAPAIAEAYYQEVPMLVVTADRPQKWINNGEGQSIDQVEVFRNYCVSSFHLNEEDDEGLIIETYKRLAEVLYGNRKGPVHLNLAFDEPLYNKVEDLLSHTFTVPTLSESNWDSQEAIKKFDKAERIMVLVGQMSQNENVEYLLSELLADKRVVVLTETNSNTYNFNFVNCIDRTLPSAGDGNYKPELIISLGGAIVSKRIKKYLRSIEDLEHWHVSESGVYPDVFEKLSEKIDLSPEQFLRTIMKHINVDPEMNFQTKWLQRSFENQERHLAFVNSAPWSDFKAHGIIHDWLPENSILHQGNSSVVRYYQLFDPIKSVRYLSNRGVSGIDGSVSTAVGVSVVESVLNILVVGDLSFVYDNNAWWNNLDKNNLLVIVINNGGGGIFRIIDGPASTGVIDEYFEVGNQTNIKRLVESHGVSYSLASNEIELDTELENKLRDYSSGKFKGGVIEVNTQNQNSEVLLKKYFEVVNPQ